MANHTLAGRNDLCQDMLDGVARRIVANLIEFWIKKGLIVLKTMASVAKGRIKAGMFGVPVVGVNYVAGRTSALGKSPG